MLRACVGAVTRGRATVRHRAPIAVRAWDNGYANVWKQAHDAHVVNLGAVVRIRDHQKCVPA